MRKRNLLIACGFAIILIGVTAAISFSIAQNTEEQDSSYFENLNPDVLHFEQMSQYIHDVELPRTMDFCGEPVPLDRFYVRESLERELLVNTYRHASTLLLMKRTSRWLPVIEPIMKKNNLPSDFKYLAMIESDLTNAVSPSKAVGFWQFLEGTGKQYNLEIYKEVDMRYHQEKETQAACDFLKDLYRRFKSWTLAAAAYNCGGGRISKTIEEQQVTSYYDMLLPNETERYIYRILAFKLIMENPEKYGFHISDEGWYQPLEYKTITVTETIENLAQFAIDQGTNLKMLKYYNPWLRSDKLTISEGNSYVIKLPK
ncbi:MAG: transglycosylase SLT domain-containing protein [Bacteroidales bacterium]|nr:transglycosylase SLT domain-containing protein [Bacteroidales bacterium]